MSTNRDVFISHHMESSAGLVRKISEALHEVGVSSWYAPRDVEDSFAGSIVNAIQNCRIFLLLLNEQSNLSPHVLNEIHCAFDRVTHHEDIVLLPFRISEFTYCPDTYYYVSRFHVMDGSEPPEMQRIRELVERICYLLGKEPTRSLTVSEPVQTAFSARPGAVERKKTYRIIGKASYPNTHFIGRRQELEQIHGIMQGPENKVFLMGMGGIGKSELARMYAKQYADDYDVVLWTSFDGSLRQTVCSDSLFPIQGLLHVDYPEDDTDAYFERKLRILKEIADRRVLIVVDNFDVFDDPALEEFCSGDYGVLFTTRCHQESGCYPEVELTGITREEDLMALFRAEYTRSLDDEGMKQVRSILRQLNGHPLSIRLVASAMQSRRISPEKMARLLKGGVSGMMKENGKAADMIYGRLRQVFRLSSLTPEEQHILMNLSLIPLRGISVELFFDWCGIDDFDIIDGLINRSWVIHDPVTDVVHLHPLVSELMQEQLAKDPDCCAKLIENLSKAANSTIFASWERKLMLSDYAVAACERLPADHPGRLGIMEGVAQLTQDRSMYREAAGMFRELLLRAQTLEMKLKYSHKYSHTLILLGEPDEGYAVAQAGCELVQGMELDNMSRLEGYYYNELLRRLVESCNAMGRHEEAIRHGQKALTFCDRFYLSSPQMDRGWVEYHLAWAYFYHGMPDQAEETIRHAIALFGEVGDEYSANYAYTMLGQILIRREQYAQALELSLKSHQILLNYYSAEHVDIAENLVWRGNIYRAMGDRERANHCYASAVEIYLKHNFFKKAQRTREKIQ